MNSMMELMPEWERIDLLGACVSANRRGMAVPNEVESRLNTVQQQIFELRQREPWISLQQNFDLDPLDQDILACSIAPEVDPKIGWMYQELQSGLSQPFPTPALIREMFAMNQEESFRFYERLSGHSVLSRNGLIDDYQWGQFTPIMPSALSRQRLLGIQMQTKLELPGARPIEAKAGWDDIVLPERCLKKLREFILWVTHRQKIEQEWSARINGGPLALFCGASGTGKTLASEVVANALGWPLYRVDLGLLVSKYIGETEKNLNALFDAAEGKELVLLFDEADSLFGKRGDVKDARDRYANMEVSHLLSRVERFNGPCILTSNFRQNIDAAFTRRFQFVVDFPLPDEQARTRLWQMHLPPKAPIHAEVDQALLGKEVSLSGGQIRNAALHAAFLAAGAESAIHLEHIADALWTELSKKEGELSPASLGTLAGHLQAELQA